MSKPLVTVITPAYNCGKYLDETIRSVLIQDYPNLDYILIDDCSTDDTQAVLAKYGSAIKLIKHTQNKGEQATVNEGLRAVFGKYFLIVNADDPLLPGAINKLVGFMEANPDILCAYPNWDCINEDSSLKLHVTPRDYDFDYLVRHHTWMMSVGSIFKSDVIKLVGYRDESFRWLGDADYWLRIGLVGKMARYPETLACWRYHNGQASSQKNSARAKEHIRVIQKYHLFLEYRSIGASYEVINSLRYGPDKISEALNKHTAILDLITNEASCWSYLVAAAVTGSKKEMISYICQAIRYHPKLLISLEFWDIAVKRAIYILRRRA